MYRVIPYNCLLLPFFSFFVLFQLPCFLICKGFTLPQHFLFILVTVLHKAAQRLALSIGHIDLYLRFRVNNHDIWSDKLCPIVSYILPIVAVKSLFQSM